MIQIPVSVGELFDKITILEIKKENGLDVEKELDLLSDISKEVGESIILTYLKEQLLLINKQLWETENSKRECESLKKFDKTFVDLARVVYIVNDQRAAIKRLINQVTNSEIVEYKQHSKY